MKSAALLFKSLADETRLRLLALLATGELCVCELMQVLDLPQSTVSRHLATLRHAGWVEDRRQGVWTYYRLAATEDPLRGELLVLLRARLAELPRVRDDLRILAGVQRRSVEPGC